MKNGKALKKKIWVCVIGISMIAMAVNVAVCLMLRFLFPVGLDIPCIYVTGFTVLFVPALYVYIGSELRKRDIAILEVTENGADEKKALVREIDASEERYRVLVENAPVGILTCDREGNIITVNHAVVKLLGSPSIEATRQVNVFTFPKLVESGISASVKKCLETGEILKVESTYTSKWGKALNLSMHFAPLHDFSGEITGVQGIVEDFTDYKEARDQLRTYYHVIEHSPVAVLISDNEEKIVYINSRYTQLTGYTAEDVLGKSTRMLYRQDSESQNYYQEMINTVRAKKIWNREFYNRKKNGEGYWENISVSPVFDDNGKIYHHAIVKEDITARKEKTEKAKYLAYHDFLTGLANRSLFYDRLTNAVANAQRYHKRLAVMYLDLDGFKEINDTYGHDTGDELLKAVAGQLQVMVRKGDTVARMGGDEFTLIIPEVEEAANVEAVAEKILTALQKPWTPKELRITGSIGIAIYPQQGADANELLKNADKAMYRAKKRGKNSCQIFREK